MLFRTCGVTNAVAAGEERSVANKVQLSASSSTRCPTILEGATRALPETCKRLLVDESKVFVRV